MDPRDYLTMDDAQLRRLDDVYARYRRLYEDPEHCQPMFIIHAPGAVRGTPTTYEQRVADPLVMLGTQLAALQTHLDIGDDCVPSVSIDFGTAQVAAAFGCELFFPENNTPAAGTHVLTRAADVQTRLWRHWGTGTQRLHSIRGVKALPGQGQSAGGGWLRVTGDGVTRDRWHGGHNGGAVPYPIGASAV